MQRQELKLVARIVENLPVMTPDVMQGWIDNPKGLKQFLSGLVPTPMETPQAVLDNPDLARWSETYYKLFNQRPDLSAIHIPEKPEGVGSVRLVVVVREILAWTKGHPLQGTRKALKRHFSCWQYESDLDEAIPTNDRDLYQSSYALWVKDVREADKDLANLSAEDLVERGIPGITSLERDLLEADYFFERGEHLDQNNWTLCSGSRNRGGYVPYANWDGRLFRGKFRADWCDVSDSHPDLCSRRVWV